MRFGTGVQFGRFAGATAPAPTPTPTPAPTAATWNPLDKGANIVLSGGNLTALGGGGQWASVRSTQSRSDTIGRYWEHAKLGGDFTGHGIANATALLEGQSFGYAGGVSYYSSGEVYSEGIRQGLFAPFADGATIMIAVKGGKQWFGLNGIWQNGDPAAGTAGASTATVGSTYFAGISSLGSTLGATVNFGASAFAYALPAGFVAFNS